METKKITASITKTQPQKNTKSYVKNPRCREKNHGAAPKNIYYNIEITTIKFVLNLSPQ